MSVVSISIVLLRKILRLAILELCKGAINKKPIKKRAQNLGL